MRMQSEKCYWIINVEIITIFKLTSVVDGFVSCSALSAPYVFDSSGMIFSRSSCLFSVLWISSGTYMQKKYSFLILILFNFN